ncbi:Cyclin-dependent kinase 11B, variant 2 [Entomophthora muscae]|uniref:Cyclin-dependent kinase 11B, variant 2 n=1 Tax=Entomophthora muscae TaxID=34485 RepID=A0ACC2S2A9_9FUNG|nr:Cyclin-dependent kinase 11B, variant 2 [Entomophthora muscae]
MDAPHITGCRSISQYEKLNRIDEGTYGVVYRARDINTNEIVALKRLKFMKDSEGFPVTSLREIHTLLIAKHPNIVNVREIVAGPELNSIYIVMDFVEHDLKALMADMPTPFLHSEVKTIMIQLLSAVALLHDHWIVHRDLKTSNLLLSNRGEIKVADFGLARKFGSPLGYMTQLVVTLWYRAPELLLATKDYSTAIDIWSIGCIFGELINNEPLMPGQGEIDQLKKIFQLLGTPSDSNWPGYSLLPNATKFSFKSQPYDNLRSRFPYLTKAGLDLMGRLLALDPAQRISAREALEHPYFRLAFISI